MRTLELIHSLKKYTLLAVVLSCVPQLWARSMNWVNIIMLSWRLCNLCFYNDLCVEEELKRN
jgi:hypothetical protein